VEAQVHYLEELIKTQTVTFKRQMFSNIKRAIEGIQSKPLDSLDATLTHKVREIVKSKAEEKDLNCFSVKKLTRSIPKYVLGGSTFCIRWLNSLFNFTRCTLRVMLTKQVSSLQI